MLRRTLLTLVTLLSFTTALSAQLREWKTGDRTVRGQYVGVEGINIVVVNSQGEKQKLPYFLQSSQNQAFIREQLRRSNDLDSLPKAGEERTWTDNNGVTFAGRLAGGDENYLYILVGKDVQAVEKERLSRSDVAFAEQSLRETKASGIPGLPTRTTTPKQDKTETTTEPKPSSSDVFNSSKSDSADDETNSTTDNSNEAGNSGASNAASADESSNQTAREQSRRKAMASVLSQRPFYVPPSNNVTSFGQAGAANAGGVVNYAPAGGGLSFIQIVAIILTIAAIAAVAMQYAGQRKTN